MIANILLIVVKSSSNRTSLTNSKVSVDTCIASCACEVLIFSATKNVMSCHNDKSHHHVGSELGEERKEEIRGQ